MLVKEEIWRLYKRHVPIGKIAELLKVSYKDVYGEISKRRGVPAGQKGINEDRHLCKTCKYKGYRHTCDYIYITGWRRGCRVEDCNKYERERTHVSEGNKEKEKEA